ncbi:hypothetical protein D3C85_1202050 [compost metagenome]
MEYVTIFFTVFFVIGSRAFQQKVVAANHYPGMGVVGAMIYMGEGAAVLMITRGGTLTHVVPGAIGAGLGVMTFVYVFNRYFSKRGSNVNPSRFSDSSGTEQEAPVRQVRDAAPQGDPQS